MKTCVPSAAAFILLALAATDAWPVTETGAPILTLPVTARAISMGETGVADNSDPSTAYFNPANVVAAPRIYAQGTWNDFVSDDAWTLRSSAGASWRTGGAEPWVLGVDVMFARFDYGESIATDPAGNFLGTVSTFENVLSAAIGAGTTFGDRYELRAGAAVKRWGGDYGYSEFSTSTNTTKLDAFAFDLGVVGVMRSTVGGWNVTPALGVAMIDAGPDFDTPDGGSDPLPWRYNFGTSVRVESPVHVLGSAEVPLVAVVGNVDATEPRHGDFEWGFGSEIALAQIFFLRTGTHVREGDADEEFTRGSWGVGLGVPVGSFRARFDYGNPGYYYEHNHAGVLLEWVF